MKWIQVQTPVRFLPYLALDLLIIGLLIILFNEGVWVQGKLLLKHGPDLRRAILVVLVAGYWLHGRYVGKATGQEETSEQERSGPKSNASSLLPPSVFLVLFHFAIQFLRVPRNRYLALGAWTVFAVATSIAQALALEYTQYDVGIFHQVLWGLSEGMGPWSSISRAGNFWMDHLALSLVLFVPFFKATGGHPLFLPVVNPLLLYGGLAAWLVCTDRFLAFSDKPTPKTFSLQFSEIFGIVTLAALLTFDSVWFNRGWGFHENTVAFFFGSWGIALLFFSPCPTSLSRLAALGCLLIAALSKEILLVDYALALAVWAPFESRKRLRIALIACAIACLGLFVWFELQPHPADKNYFVRYYGYLGSSLPQFAKTLLFDPFRVVESVGAQPLRTYFWEVFKYWCLVPLIAAALNFRAKKSENKVGNPTRFLNGSSPPESLSSSAPTVDLLKFPLLWLLPILPSFASCALATYPPLRWIRFHYVLELWPFLIALTLAFLMQRRTKVLVVIWGLWMGFQWNSSPVADFASNLAHAENRKPVLAAIRNLAKIEPNASIAAIEEAGPWLASRKLISRYPDLDLIPNECPDWIIVRTTSELNQPLLDKRLSRCGWTASPLPTIPGERTLPPGKQVEDPGAVLTARDGVNPLKIQEWLFYRLPSTSSPQP